VVRAAIDMGHGLGLKVIAEGIESEEAALRLRNFGCDVAQGYLYSEPLPLPAFEAWILGRERVPVIAVPVDFKIENLVETSNLALY
jgi:EAL domain-containing protein (putative c-di-GMP-specific phosphodiesterase class I)